MRLMRCGRLNADGHREPVPPPTIYNNEQIPRYLFLGAASQRTTRLRLGALVFCLPWYDPLRLYHEICMLDQLSKGRLEVGVGRGVSPVESTYYGISSPEMAREKFQESLDILLRAFTSDSLEYEGKWYRYEGVELWNKRGSQSEGHSRCRGDSDLSTRN